MRLFTLVKLTLSVTRLVTVLSLTMLLISVPLAGCDIEIPDCAEVTYSGGDAKAGGSVKLQKCNPTPTDGAANAAVTDTPQGGEVSGGDGSMDMGAGDDPAEALAEMDEDDLQALCDDIGFEGTCEGDTLLYCDGTQIWFADCAAEGLTCGFDTFEGYFDCLGDDDDDLSYDDSYGDDGDDDWFGDGM